VRVHDGGLYPGLAKQGLSAAEILKRYYPGARLERAYE